MNRQMDERASRPTGRTMCTTEYKEKEMEQPGMCGRWDVQRNQTSKTEKYHARLTEVLYKGKPADFTEMIPLIVEAAWKEEE